MNVKKSVKLSFIVITILVVLIFAINNIILYEVRENNTLKDKIALLIEMQGNMNRLVKKVMETEDKNELVSLEKSFHDYELEFERVKDELTKKSRDDILDIFAEDIHKNSAIQEKITTLSKNEKDIEIAFEKILDTQAQKIEYVALFEREYPNESLVRNSINDKVMEYNDIDILEIFSNVRYYSKEMLFQHKNIEYYNKWIDKIDELNKIFDIPELDKYREISKQIGGYILEIERLIALENELAYEIENITTSSRELGFEMKKDIENLSEEFIDSNYFIIIAILSITILIVLFLSHIVNRFVSMSVDHIEKEVQNGLVEINKLNTELEDTQREVVFTMGAIGESRSKETGNHVKRVAKYSEILALHYGLSKKEADLLKQASPMHDIGKVAIPDAILNKPGIFDEDEREIMKKHAKIGYDMLCHSNRPLLKTAAIVALEHHEKWDGSGYPKGVSGEDIHIYGRITALADVFDALGSDRCYKKAWSDERIFKLFAEERGKHFDPKLVDIFFDNLSDFLRVREEFRD